MKNKGFTLVEIIISVFIISIGVMGAFSVLQKVVVSSSVSSDKLVAAYLAQEGIELVRNIRDSSWIDGQAWDIYIVGEGFTYDMDIYDQKITGESHPHIYYIKPTVKPNSNFYEKSMVGKFITIKKEDVDGEDLNPEKMTIIAEVAWEERGRFHNVIVEEILYDYHQEIE